MKAKCVVLILAAVLVGAGLAHAEAPVLKIGFIGPISGGGVSWGYAALAGLELAMDDVNKTGGLKVGDAQYLLKAVPYDSKFRPDDAVNAAKRLIYEDKVKIIFGGIGAAAVLAVQGITEPMKIIYFSDSYGHRTLSPDKPYAFRWSMSNVEFTPSQLAYYRKRWPESKRLGYFYPDDESGRSMLEWTQKFGKQYGYEVVGFPWERGTADLTPVVLKAMTQKMDIMDLDGSPPGEAGQIVNILRDMGWNKPIGKTGGAVAYDLIRICGKKANGVVYHEDADLAYPAVADLVKRFKEKGYPAAPNTLMIPAYDGATLLLKAIQIAGSVEDTTAIKNAMEKMDSLKGIHGSKLSWGGMEHYGINHQLMNVSFIGELVDEKATIVEKINLAE